MPSIILGKTLYFFSKPCFLCDICDSYGRMKVSENFGIVLLQSIGGHPRVCKFKILPEIKWLSVLGSPLQWAYTKFRFSPRHSSSG
jgi:hypothetical protein